MRGNSRWYEIERAQMEKSWKRGPVAPDDPRDFAAEAQEEVFDGWWYLGQEMLRCADAMGREVLSRQREELHAIFLALEDYRGLRDGN